MRGSSLVVCEGSDFYQAALDGQFGVVQQSRRSNKVKLIRIAQSDSAFQRLLDLAEKIRARCLDFVADSPHRCVGQTIQGKCIEPLSGIAVEPGPDSQLSKKNPL